MFCVSSASPGSLDFVCLGVKVANGHHLLAFQKPEWVGLGGEPAPTLHDSCWILPLPQSCPGSQVLFGANGRWIPGWSCQAAFQGAQPLELEEWKHSRAWSLGKGVATGLVYMVHFWLSCQWKSVFRPLLPQIRHLPCLCVSWDAQGGVWSGVAASGLCW